LNSTILENYEQIGLNALSFSGSRSDNATCLNSGLGSATSFLYLRHAKAQRAVRRLKSPLARLFGKVAKNFDVLGGLSTQISHPGCVMADLRGILFIFYSQRKSFS